jgi:hypothetical protein
LIGLLSSSFATEDAGRKRTHKACTKSETWALKNTIKLGLFLYADGNGDKGSAGQFTPTALYVE